MPHPFTRPSRRARFALVLLSILVCLVGGEAASRLFWRCWRGVPLLDPGRVLYAYYPDLAVVDRLRPAHEDGFYDVLLLGGSVLHPDWTPIAHDLAEELARAGRRNVRIFNLAMPGHTTRDSRLKYEAVSDARFDLVVVYDGINDVRANNVPPELYRPDYAHFTWYEAVNALAPYHGAARVALPYTLRFFGVETRRVLLSGRYVPRDAPRSAWTRYGSDLKTTAAFEDNLDAIIRMADARRDPLVLMTFALYAPEHPSDPPTADWTIGEQSFANPIDLWGERQAVVSGVDAQNEVVRRIAAAHRDVRFVDQARLIEASRRNFNDPCHLTVAGSVSFVENLLPAATIDLR